MIFSAIVLPIVVQPRDHVVFGIFDMLRHQIICQLRIASRNGFINLSVFLLCESDTGAVLHGDLTVALGLSVQRDQSIPNHGTTAEIAQKFMEFIVHLL